MKKTVCLINFDDIINHSMQIIIEQQKIRSLKSTRFIDMRKKQALHYAVTKSMH